MSIRSAAFPTSRLHHYNVLLSIVSAEVKQAGMDEKVRRTAENQSFLPPPQWYSFAPVVLLLLSPLFT